MVKKILVIGDSIAYGKGAKQKDCTFEGRLRKDYPDAKIENYAFNGAKTKDVLKQLDKAKEKTYDLIVMNVGMNDVFHLTKYNHLKKDLKELLEKAHEKGKKVVMSTGGDIKIAPKIFWPFKKIFGIEEKRLIKLFKEFSKKIGITYVDLSEEKSLAKEIKKNPKKYLSEDLLHPNDEGYKLWYSLLKKNF